MISGDEPTIGEAGVGFDKSISLFIELLIFNSPSHISVNVPAL